MSNKIDEIIYIYIGDPMKYQPWNDYDFIISYYLDEKLGKEKYYYVKPESLNQNQIIYCFDYGFDKIHIENLDKATSKFKASDFLKEK